MSARLLFCISFVLASVATPATVSAQWLGGLSAASDSLAKGIDRQIDFENQKELMLLQYKLEAERDARKRQLDQQDQARKREEKPTGLAYLDKTHPGWREAVRTESFSKWIAAQPPNVSNLTKSQHTDDASALLYMYEAHLASQKK